jgi:hypothetical protein
MTVDQLRSGAPEYAEARCGLPGCGEPLYLVRTFSRPVYLSDTAADLNELGGAYTVTWHVECLAGHTILVPGDTGEENYEFGSCTRDPDEAHPLLCGHNDMDRLRAVVQSEERD